MKTEFCRRSVRTREEAGWSPAAPRWVNASPYRCLAPQTWSVLDFIRTDLRTLRLAIACGERSERALHPSQVTVRRPSAFQKRNS